LSGLLERVRSCRGSVLKTVIRTTKIHPQRPVQVIDGIGQNIQP